MTSHLEAARYAQEYDECEHGVPGSAQCIDCLIRSHRDEVAALNDEAERLTSDLERARRILEDRDASLSAEEYEQRAADDAAILASPKAGEILGALEREALYERHLRWRTLAQVKRLRAELEEVRTNLERVTAERDEAERLQRVDEGTLAGVHETLAPLFPEPGYRQPRPTTGDLAVLLVDRLEELRLTLAAEQGKPEGAPHPDWHHDAGTWIRYYADCDSAIVYSDGTWARGRFGERARTKGRAPNRRAAMLAADAALSGEATTSPSAPAPQGSQTPQ